jgi:hypothetical protein
MTGRIVLFVVLGIMVAGVLNAIIVPTMVRSGFGSRLTGWMVFATLLAGIGGGVWMAYHTLQAETRARS